MAMLKGFGFVLGIFVICAIAWLVWTQALIQTRFGPGPTSYDVRTFVEPGKFMLGVGIGATTIGCGLLLLVRVVTQFLARAAS
jgi:hypothetical protein